MRIEVDNSGLTVEELEKMTDAQVLEHAAKNGYENTAELVHEICQELKLTQPEFVGMTMSRSLNLPEEARNAERIFVTRMFDAGVFRAYDPDEDDNL